MGSFGQLALSDIRQMLESCAPGHTIKKQTHNYLVCFNGRSYPSLPLGPHGKADPQIEKGHVKRMARFFGILDCARQHLKI